MASSLVRDVVERTTNSGSSAPQQFFVGGSGGSSKTGFPAVQHRSKATSAFKRAKQDERVQSGLRASKERLDNAQKPIDRTKSARVGGTTVRAAEDWMEDISRSNEEAVARMSSDERAQEKEDIVDRFGTGIEGLMAKVREARERRAAHQVAAAPRDISPNNANPSVISAAKSAPPSPRARAARKIRFAEPTEADVHVYESQPSSPKRFLALLPPPENSEERSDISSLGTFKGSLKPQETYEEPPSPSSTPEESTAELPEEGTPEDIRRRFFPSEAPPEANPSLAWMLPSSASSSKSPPLSDSKLIPAHNPDIDLAIEPRYSLTGARLSPSEISSLPTHLGLHHHASAVSSDAPAGYTLPDLLLLARSSVPAQRASVLGVLAKLLRTTREQVYGHGHGPSSFAQEAVQVVSKSQHDVDLDSMRRDMLDAAIDALGERGGVGQRAVDVLWEAIVGFTEVELGVAKLDGLAGVDFSPRLQPPPASPKPVPKTSIDPSSSSKSSTPVLLSLPLLQLLPALNSHLIASPSPRSRTHVQVLDILLVLSHLSHHAQTIVNLETGAGVIGTLVGPHLRSSFDADEDSQEETRATTTSIRVLQVLARSDRDNASKLTGPADVLLRYVTAPLPPLNPVQPQSDVLSSSRQSLALLEETLQFYTVLSQYGLYAQVATTAQDHFARIGAWLLDALRTISEPSLTSLTRAYLRLLEIWIVCAIDPHRTTPSHDILWSQVQGWGWGEWIMDLAGLVASASEPASPSPFLGARTPANNVCAGLWAGVCQTVAAWLEGTSVNGVKGGEEERALALARLSPLFEPRHGLWQAVRGAVTTLRDWEPSPSSDAQAMGTLQDLAEAAGLVAAEVRLALACLGPGAGKHSLDIPTQEIHDVCKRFIDDSGRGPFDLVLGEWDEADVPQYAHALLRPLSTLLVRQLRFWRQSIVPPELGTAANVATLDKEWTAQASSVLGNLIPGDEGYAQSVIETLCNDIDATFIQKFLPSTDVPHEFWDKDGMKVLLPFLVHSLRPTTTANSKHGGQGQTIYIAPISPTPESIAQCTTLNLPSFAHVRKGWKSRDEGIALPLRNDWPTLPLNHLLRSGTSPVFHALPPSWNASETDVVRASLLLARIVQEVLGTGNLDAASRLCMSRAEAIFACMKVFMLEHGQQQGDSGEEVFRDVLVTRWMEDLLKPFAYANSSEFRSYETTEEPRTSLEHVSKAFLGGGTPFYQFYTDFLALYDAISFSHPLFARLLLPPVSMSYPIDYRKLLFGDLSHVLRTIRTDVQDVLSGDVREYLWPVEHDVHVIGWYLKALVMSHLHGFVRWVAIHHVAANIWPEFRDGDIGGQERAWKLLSAVLQQGSMEIVRDVVSYRQLKQEVWLPPKCFLPGEMAWRERRLEWVERIADERTKTRLQSLLLE